MKTVFAFAVAMTAILAPQSAGAVTHKIGFIEAIDTTSKKLTIVSYAGSEKQYQLSEHTRVIVNGDITTIAALCPKQKVTLSLPAEPKPEYVKATIVNINLEQGTALVKPAGEALMNVRLSDQTKVSGKVDSVEELTEGQSIKIRFAQAL